MSSPQPIGYASPTTYARAFAPSEGRATLAKRFIQILIVLTVFSNVAGTALLLSIDLEALETQGAQALPGWAIAASIGVGVLGLVLFVIGILAIVFYCRWQFRAHHNLYALNLVPQYTPGWGIGYWFIPVVNLFRPFQTLREIAVLSDPDRKGFSNLGLFWTCWITGMVLSNVSARITTNMVTLSSVGLVAMGITIVAYVLLMKLIDFIVEGQSKQIGNVETIRAY